MNPFIPLIYLVFKSSVIFDIELAENPPSKKKGVLGLSCSARTGYVPNDGVPFVPAVYQDFGCLGRGSAVQAGVFLGVVVVDPHPGDDRRVEFLERPEHLFPVPDPPVGPLHLVVVIAVALACRVDVLDVADCCMFTNFHNLISAFNHRTEKVTEPRQNLQARPGSKNPRIQDKTPAPPNAAGPEFSGS